MLIIVLFTSLTAFAQIHPSKSVQLFQSFYRDAQITSQPFIDTGLDFNNFEYANTFNFGLRSGIPIKSKFDLGAAVHFISLHPDRGDGESGLSDIWLSAKYRIDNVFLSRTTFSAGGFMTLPVGDEEVGQNRFNFGGFGAIRHPLSSRFTLTSVFGLDFVETGVDNQTSSLLFGSGLIYTYDYNLNFVGEIQIQSEYDYAMLTVGTDYKLSRGDHVRGGLGVGLDEGAPDFSLLVSYMFRF
jgi:hypothetical protein